MKKQTLFSLFIAILFVVGFGFTSTAYGKDAKSDKKESLIITISTQNYNKETAKGLVIVDFWAPWCGPCRKMNPILEEVSKEMKDVVKIGKLNVDENKKIAIEKGVQSIPTMIIYKNGKEVDRIKGVVPKEELKKAITIYSSAD